jgi:hypothetical protein
MYGALFRSQQARAREVHSLRTCLVAGDICPLQLQEQFSSAFGVPCDRYGLQPKLVLASLTARNRARSA